MPFSSEGVESGIGLALSGGGFRATLFHCGALWRLNELGYLPKLARISSVSGGSIAAGRLAVRWHALKFSGGVATNLVEEVIQPLRQFCERSIDTPSILKGILLPGKRISEAVLAEYEKHLVGKATLQDLPDTPRFVFNATNFSTGVDFSKPNVSTKSEALQTMTLATAAASNAVLNPAPAPEPVSLEVVAPPQAKPQGKGLINRAWAEQGSVSRATLFAQVGAYFVVIGKYGTEREAWQALGQLSRDRLKTELYFPKSLRVLRAGTGTYYVSYSGPLTQEDAAKLFKLIRINDPNLSPDLLKQK